MDAQEIFRLRNFVGVHNFYTTFTQLLHNFLSLRKLYTTFTHLWLCTQLIHSFYTHATVYLHRLYTEFTHHQLCTHPWLGIYAIFTQLLHSESCVHKVGCAFLQNLRNFYTASVAYTTEVVHLRRFYTEFTQHQLCTYIWLSIHAEYTQLLHS